MDRHLSALDTGLMAAAPGRLRRTYGHGKWRKCKGYADVKLPDGATLHAELHWYEAHGRGRFELKIKRYVE